MSTRCNFTLAIVLASLMAAPALAGPPPDMVKFPASEFIMGCDLMTQRACDDDNHPPHEVALDAFWLDRTEVTQAAYEKCVQQGGCTPVNKRPRLDFTYGELKDPRNEPGWEAHPVTGVTWQQADRYCGWADKRLPTEAEWERAARGTEGRRFPWGSAWPTCDLAVIWEGDISLDQSQMGCSRQSTWPVCSKPAGNTPEGLCDMHGNVNEWVADRYHPRFYQVSPKKNPGGPTMGDDHVVRGPGLGSKQGDAMWRFHLKAQRISKAQGFRCARSERKSSRIVTGIRKGADTSAIDAMGSKNDIYAVQLVLAPEDKGQQIRRRFRWRKQAKFLDKLRKQALSHIAAALQQQGYKIVNHPYGFVLQVKLHHTWVKRTDDSSLRMELRLWGRRGSNLTQESASSSFFKWKNQQAAKTQLLLLCSKLVGELAPKMEQHLRGFLADFNALPVHARLIKAPEGIRMAIHGALKNKCRSLSAGSRKQEGIRVVEIKGRCLIDAGQFEEIVNATIAIETPETKHKLSKEADGTLVYTFD